jgi:hypothetical protein
MGVTAMFYVQLILTILVVSIILAFITAGILWAMQSSSKVNVPNSEDPVPKM